MTNRGGRLPQVRPRPPSTGRPAPVKVRPRAPSHTRLAAHRHVERPAGMSIGARLLLVVGVVALGGAVLYTATGGLGRIATALGASVTGLVGGLTATPVPSPTPIVVGDPPIIESPQEPYTNQPAVDLVVLVPGDAVAGAKRVRVYASVGGKPAKRVAEASVGPIPRVVIADVNLVAGANDFSATLIGPGGETDRSPVVTFVLDQSKPKITIASPKDGATVNKDTATITGKTQGRSTVTAQNAASASSTTVVATADGSFSLVVTLAEGVNPIAIQATDPAGNVGEAAISLRRGTGKLAASLSASAYRFSRARLPQALVLRVLVTDPDGTPLAGARTTFSVTISGVAPITADRTTGADGRAEFRTTVPKGAAVGTGQALVLVSAGSLGTTTDRTVITITK